MKNKDLVFKFKNSNEKPLIIVIDPPCVDFALETGKELMLKIIEYRSCPEDVSDIIDVRYATENIINVDINYSFKLMVVIDNKEEIIWGF